MTEQQDDKKAKDKDSEATAKKSSDKKSDKNSDPAKDQAPQATSKNIATLGSDIEILTDKPLPHLNSGELRAFAARTSNGKSCFAILCENHLVPRTFQTSKFSQLANANIARVMASGVIYWPPENVQKYVFIFEDNLGNPILSVNDDQALGMKHERLMNAVIKPLVVLLLELRDADLTHGGIRATNIFDGNTGNYDHIMLGEALSAPPSYHQPTFYMPIEKAIAHPASRGPTSFADDIFALGVTILVLMRKDDPFKSMTEEDMIRHRIEHGSYSFYISNQRNSGPLMELVRNLLHDDWQQRWTIEEVLAWMDGKRLSPKKGAQSRSKSTRSFDFENQKFNRPQTLAYEMILNPKIAKNTIESAAFETWLQRSLNDDKVLDHFFQGMAKARDGGKNTDYPDRFLCNSINALFEKTPLVYKTVRTMPEGIGSTIAYHVGTHNSVAPLRDIIRYQMVNHWCLITEDAEFDPSALIQKFDSARANAAQKRLGYGIEGNLYFLSPECPCLSEHLSRYYVRSPEDLLLAFENLCANTHKMDGFMDMHIAGFLLARDKRIIENELPDLASSELHTFKRALISVFANIQERGRMGPLPHLSKALITYISPLFDRYHDRKKRKETKEKMDKLAETGDIARISRVINDKHTIKKDTDAFKRALKEYQLLKKEQDYLGEQLDFNKKFGMGTGHEIAAIVSGVIAVIIVLASTFLQYSKGAVF